VIWAGVEVRRKAWVEEVDTDWESGVLDVQDHKLMAKVGMDHKSLRQVVVVVVRMDVVAATSDPTRKGRTACKMVQGGGGIDRKDVEHQA
jgi:hypothetical protein